MKLDSKLSQISSANAGGARRGAGGTANLPADERLGNGSDRP